jgi:hypothetical protein
MVLFSLQMPQQRYDTVIRDELSLTSSRVYTSPNTMLPTFRSPVWRPLPHHGIMRTKDVVE